jgi:hypothetical protein
MNNEEKICINCRFSSDLNCRMVFCHRYPPAPYYDPMRDPLDAARTPRVCNDHWCGEWKEKKQ